MPRKTPWASPATKAIPFSLDPAGSSALALTAAQCPALGCHTFMTHIFRSIGGFSRLHHQISGHIIILSYKTIQHILHTPGTLNRQQRHTKS